MKRFAPILLILLVALGTASAEGIAWHEGSVESAFELAREQDKPIFLYWGAVWCPPCNQIKKTIFTRREFIEKSALFVPVYLDGDTESAQTWGERLDVWGYPTMLVMSPDGREVMRMPTGLQVEEFNEVLDEALRSLEPIEEVLEKTLEATDPARVPDGAYRRLAFHSWAQDRSLEFSELEQEEFTRELATRAPERLPRVRSRLYMLWLAQAASLAGRPADDGEAPFTLTPEQRQQAEARVIEILDSHELTIVNLEYLTYYSDSMIPAIHPRKSKARRKLEERWLATMEWVESNEALSVDERLSSVSPALDLHDLERGKSGRYPRDLVARVRNLVTWTDQTADDHYTRQATISGAGYLLRRVGLDDEARALYLAEIEKSETPWYFMSSLSSMARSRGDNDEAVRWLARAYEAAEGRATRFQWGTSYLMGMMDLVPEDGQLIREESMRVFQELMSLDDAFAGRNNSRIKRLAGSYGTWNAAEAHAVEVDALRSSLLPECDGMSDEPDDNGDSLRSRCSEFFTTLGAG